jgi:hypothetical protein
MDETSFELEKTNQRDARPLSKIRKTVQHASKQEKGGVLGLNFYFSVSCVCVSLCVTLYVTPRERQSDSVCQPVSVCGVKF